MPTTARAQNMCAVNATTVGTSAPFVLPTPSAQKKKEEFQPHVDEGNRCDSMPGIGAEHTLPERSKKDGFHGHEHPNRIQLPQDVGRCYIEMNQR